MLQGAFDSLAQSLGSVIQQYVIYGKTAPAVLRQVLAATLAQIAAEAAVNAIKAAAYGFLFLATGNYAAAANAFVSAGLWASIAVGAALVGRAIAPKQSGSQAVAKTTSGSGGTGASRDTKRDTSGQGRIFSSKEDAISEAGINRPQESQVIEIRFTEKPEWFGNALAADISINGRSRKAIRLVANEG